MKMFVVYSPGVQNKLGMSRVVPNLRVDPSKAVSAPDKANLDRFKMDDEEFVLVDRGKQAETIDQQPVNPAIKQYESTMSPYQGKNLVVKAREIMSDRVLTITADMSIYSAWSIMKEKNIRHLPVLDNGLLIGLCSSTSIMCRSIISKDGHLEDIRGETVKDVMDKEVIASYAHVDIRKIAAIMSEHRLGCVPIMSEVEQLVGIVTLSDIVKRLAEEPPIKLYV